MNYKHNLNVCFILKSSIVSPIWFNWLHCVIETSEMAKWVVKIRISWKLTPAIQTKNVGKMSMASFVKSREKNFLKELVAIHEWKKEEKELRNFIFNFQSFDLISKISWMYQSEIREKMCKNLDTNGWDLDKTLRSEKNLFMTPKSKRNTTFFKKCQKSSSIFGPSYHVTSYPTRMNIFFLDNLYALYVRYLQFMD